MSRTPSTTRTVIIYYDLETTGLHRATDAIVEIALRVDPRLYSAKYESLIQTSHPMDPGALAVHKITPDMLADAPTLEEVEEELSEWLSSVRVTGGYTRVMLVAHNNFDFDRAFFRRSFSTLTKQSKEWLVHADSLIAFRIGLGIGTGLALRKLAILFGCTQEERQQSHRAGGDVDMLISVLTKCSVDQRQRVDRSLCMQCRG